MLYCYFYTCATPPAYEAAYEVATPPPFKFMCEKMTCTASFHTYIQQVINYFQV